MSKRVLQFGTSRFLQAHVDLFVHEARMAGQDIGPITIVKTTTGGAREGRVEALGSGKGFPVHLQGYDNGRLVDETLHVESVARALDANREWQRLIRLFVAETEIVVSNVGDGGYELVPEDRQRPKSFDTIPAGFPAKLLALLVQRFEGGGKPLLVRPCELISNNGNALRHILEDLSYAWGLTVAFALWLKNAVMICDTLVDRIVSEQVKPIGAKAEPYGLWAIKREPGFVPPFKHPNVTYTDDLEPYLRLKLHILNLGHTYLAEIWKTEGRRSDEIVREILMDLRVKNRLMSLYNEEIVPGFAARGTAVEATGYIATTLERFENPFLNQRISDIIQNHAIKVERRMADFIAWVRGKDLTAKFPGLEGVIRNQAR
jgi:tagaturonate reductase